MRRNKTMITKESLNQYRQFEIDFRETCKHICELLVRYDNKYKGSWEEFEIFDEPEYSSKFVECTYYTYCMCERDAETNCFPMEFLFMSDDEINKWIDDKLEEERIEKERKRQEEELKAKQQAERDAIKKREHDLAEYERIKKEYNL